MALLRTLDTFVYLPAIIPLDPCKSLPIFNPSAKKTVVEKSVQVLSAKKEG